MMVYNITNSFLFSLHATVGKIACQFSSAHASGQKCSYRQITRCGASPARIDSMSNPRFGTRQRRFSGLRAESSNKLNILSTKISRSRSALLSTIVEVCGRSACTGARAEDDVIRRLSIRSDQPCERGRKGSTMTPLEQVRENCDPMSRVVPKVA